MGAGRLEGGCSLWRAGDGYVDQGAGPGHILDEIKETESMGLG